MMKREGDESVAYFRSQSNESFEFVRISNDERRQSNSTFELVEETVCNKDDTDLIENFSFDPLSKGVFETYFDDDGRLVEEVKLREALFHGGSSPIIRREVWSFIFGLYPVTSTKRERLELNVQNYCRYQALKKHSIEFLKTDCGLKDEEMENLSACTDSEACNSCSLVLDTNHPTIDSHKSMAEIFARKQPKDLATVSDWYRVIDKDIPRTDIDHPYFQQNTEVSLQQMRNILVTFGFFHPKIGYVQGMNDILTRFMVVMGSEVDAYWCFSNYMESVEQDFDESGMVEKIDHVCKLLDELEPNLMSHFRACSVPDLLFCHRWLLVSFQREFNYDESIRCFEVVHSRYLKFDSHIAMATQDQERRLEMLKVKGKPVSQPDISNVKYELDVFVCVSTIMLKRQQFLACTDAAEVFRVACNIRGTLDLEEVYKKAYCLFFKYCRKYAQDHYANERNVGLKSVLNAISRKLFNIKKA